MIVAKSNQIDTFPNVSALPTQTASDRLIKDALTQLRRDSVGILQKIDALKKFSQTPEKDRGNDPVLNSFVELNIGPGDTVSGFIRLRAGKGSPEGVITGSAGRDAWFRTDGAAATFIYLKETGQGNTGWVPVATTSTAAVNDATYITQTPNSTLSAEQALSALATGILKSTTATGVVSIAVLDTDFYGPGSATIEVTTSFKVNGVKVIGAQGTAVADAAGGATIDAEARTAINALLARARAHGLIAT